MSEIFGCFGIGLLVTGSIFNNWVEIVVGFLLAAPAIINCLRGR